MGRDKAPQEKESRDMNIVHMKKEIVITRLVLPKDTEGKEDG